MQDADRGDDLLNRMFDCDAEKGPNKNKQPPPASDPPDSVISTVENGAFHVKVTAPTQQRHTSSRLVLRR